MLNDERTGNYIRVYIATKYEAGPRAAELAEVLTDLGHDITYEWWKNEQFTAEQAAFDAEGVVTADALIFIAEEDYRYAGAYVEMGMALALGIPVLLLGHAIDKCIFVKLPGVISVTEDTLVQQLLML